MANSNIIAGYFGGTGRNQMLPQTLASGTETELAVGVDSGVTNTIAVLSMPLQSAIVGSVTPLDQTVNPALLDSGFARPIVPGVPPNGVNAQVFDFSKPFLVRLAGYYTPLTGSSSVSMEFRLYLGTTKGGTKIADTAAVPNTNAAAASFGFLLEAQLKWDSKSQAVRGQFWWDVDGTSTGKYGTWQTLSGFGSAVASPAALQFCATAQWGAANGGTVTPSEFSLTQL